MFETLFEYISLQPARWRMKPIYNELAPLTSTFVVTEPTFKLRDNTGAQWSLRYINERDNFTVFY